MFTDQATYEKYLVEEEAASIAAEAIGKVARQEAMIQLELIARDMLPQADQLLAILESFDRSMFGVPATDDALTALLNLSERIWTARAYMNWHITEPR